MSEQRWEAHAQMIRADRKTFILEYILATKANPNYKNSGLDAAQAAIEVADLVENYLKDKRGA